MSKTLVKFRQHLLNDKGATMVEYGLMVALIAVVVAVAATVLGTNISTLFAGLSFP